MHPFFAASIRSVACRDRRSNTNLSHRCQRREPRLRIPMRARSNGFNFWYGALLCFVRSIANLRATFGSFRRQSGSFPFPGGVTLVSSCAVISRSPALGQKERERDGWMDRGNRRDGSDTASSWMLEPPPRRAAATMILPVPSPSPSVCRPPRSVTFARF